jgi:hypothetical protein
MNKQISTRVGIAAVVAAAIIVGGVIWLTQSPVQNTVSVPVKKAAANNQQNNVSVGWKNYKNTTYGIEFSYPQAWKIDQERSSVNETVFDVGAGATESIESISFQKNTKNLTLVQIKDEMIPADSVSFEKQTNLTIAGEKAIKVDSGEFAQTFYVFLHSNNAYMITTQSGFTKQILDTIKFVN